MPYTRNGVTSRRLHAEQYTYARWASGWCDCHGVRRSENFIASGPQQDKHLATARSDWNRPPENRCRTSCRRVAAESTWDAVARLCLPHLLRQSHLQLIPCFFPTDFSARRKVPQLRWVYFSLGERPRFRAREASGWARRWRRCRARGPGLGRRSAIALWLWSSWPCGGPKLCPQQRTGPQRKGLPTTSCPAKRGPRRALLAARGGLGGERNTARQYSSRLLLGAQNQELLRAAPREFWASAELASLVHLHGARMRMARSCKGGHECCVAAQRSSFGGGTVNDECPRANEGMVTVRVNGATTSWVGAAAAGGKWQWQAGNLHRLWWDAVCLVARYGIQ